jgi:hypothetical protein
MRKCSAKPLFRSEFLRAFNSLRFRTVEDQLEKATPKRCDGVVVGMIVRGDRHDTARQDLRGFVRCTASESRTGCSHNVTCVLQNKMARLPFYSLAGGTARPDRRRAHYGDRIGTPACSPLSAHRRDRLRAGCEASLNPFSSFVVSPASYRVSLLSDASLLHSA